MRLFRLSMLGALPAMLALSVTAVMAQTDPRLVTHAYDAAKIVKIEGRPGVQATIVFGEDEKIENVAVGDSQKWQITPNKRANLLFARPLEDAAATNMTVVTDKRTYLFDLVATARERPVYMLRFTYGNEMAPVPEGLPQAPDPPPALAAAPLPPPVAPALEAIPQPDPLPPVAEVQAPPLPAPAPLGDPQPAPVIRSAVDEAISAPASIAPSAALAEAEDAGLSETALAEPPKQPRRTRRERVAKQEPPPQQQVMPEVASVPIAPPVTVEAPGAINFAWTRDGSKSLLPERIYDDGRATYLVWNKKQKIPSVLVADAQGQEIAPDLIEHESSIVLSGVPSPIVLRRGKSSATLENMRPLQISASARQRSAQIDATGQAGGSN